MRFHFESILSNVRCWVEKKELQKQDQLLLVSNPFSSCSSWKPLKLKQLRCFVSKAVVGLALGFRLKVVKTMKWKGVSLLYNISEPFGRIKKSLGTFFGDWMQIRLEDSPPVLWLWVSVWCLSSQFSLLALLSWCTHSNTHTTHSLSLSLVGRWEGGMRPSSLSRTHSPLSR